MTTENISDSSNNDNAETKQQIHRDPKPSRITAKAMALICYVCHANTLYTKLLPGPGSGPDDTSPPPLRPPYAEAHHCHLAGIVVMTEEGYPLLQKYSHLDAADTAWRLMNSDDKTRTEETEWLASQATRSTSVGDVIIVQSITREKCTVFRVEEKGFTDITLAAVGAAFTGDPTGTHPGIPSPPKPLVAFIPETVANDATVTSRVREMGYGFCDANLDPLIASVVRSRGDAYPCVMSSDLVNILSERYNVEAVCTDDPLIVAEAIRAGFDVLVVSKRQSSSKNITNVVRTSVTKFSM